MQIKGRVPLTTPQNTPKHIHINYGGYTKSKLDESIALNLESI